MSEGRFFSIDDKIKCLKREIAMRERAYPKWKMDPEKARWEIDCMKAILEQVMETAGRTDT